MISGAIGVAPAVGAVTGSRAALRLVNMVLAHDKQVTAVLWRQHGGVYDSWRQPDTDPLTLGRFGQQLWVAYTPLRMLQWRLIPRGRTG